MAVSHSTRSSTVALPRLTTAQIMADLDGLNNCEHSSALALLRASSNLCPQQIRRKSKASILPTPPRFDSLGKRIVSPVELADGTESSTSGRMGSVIRGTLSEDESGEKDVVVEDNIDIERANELVDIFKKKGSLTRMGTMDLNRVKEKVDEVVQKNAQKELHRKQKAAKEKCTGF